MELLKAVNRVKNGELYRRTREIIEKLVEEDAHISVYLDYPQEDIEEVEIEKLKINIKEQKERLEEILKGAKFRTILENGINVAIVGNPNVGKSTIMNILSQEEKSIVTDVEGTTRDVLKNQIEINGLKFILCDTAGIRKTNDKVERIGVLKAIETLKEAEIVLFVCDGTTKEEDLKVLDNNKDSKKILIYNKTDLKYSKNDFKGYSFDCVLYSSKENIKSIDRIKEEMYKLKESEGLRDRADILILNERQKIGIKKAIENLDSVMNFLEKGSFLDMVLQILDSAIENLLELTGEKVMDLVVDEIFSKFCVGK